MKTKFKFPTGKKKEEKNPQKDLKVWNACDVESLRGNCISRECKRSVVSNLELQKY